MRPLDRVVVYADPRGSSVRPRDVAADVGGALGAEAREGRLGPGGAGPLASCLARSLFRPHRPAALGPAEEEAEARGGPPRPGDIYDGHALQAALAALVPGAARRPRWAHVVLTDRLVGTYDPGGMRYHARTVVCADPAVVSAAGLVEGPARPRSAYVPQLGLPPGDFLSRGDPRLARAAAGCALQALAYLASGEPFCPDPLCRLHDAHTQEGLLRSQGGLCGRHRRALYG